jgi:mgtE-like transporter
MALPRRARRLWAYWRAEQRTLRQGLVALALSTLAGFVAGLTLAHITGTLEELPGLIVLIPAAVGMKGTIFGAIGEPTLRRGSVLQRNVYVAVVTTFSSALWLAVLSVLASAAFGEPSISLWRLATVSIVGGALGSALILMITLTLSVLSFRRGWDLDSVSTPMVTALGDMTTLPSLFLATYLLRSDLVAVPAAVISIAVAVYAAIRSYTVADRVIRRIVVEMTAVILLTPILDILAGTLLRARQDQLVAVPVLLALIPPFVSQAGALGGIFTSRTASKLQIGVITARGLPEIPALVDASIVSTLSIAVFAMVGVVAYALGVATDLVGMPSLPALVVGTVLAGVIVTPITLVAGYYLAIGTFRFGLDPDDQSVPIITSVMDLAGVAVVLFVMTSLGVLPNG